MLSLLIDFNFDNIDNKALLVAAIGYAIVFIALVLLYFVFSNLPKILNLRKRALMRKQGKECTQPDLTVPGEVTAAISTAMYMFLNEMHDDESNIVTIKKVSRAYSPWSSKIYGLDNYNRIKN